MKRTKLLLLALILILTTAMPSFGISTPIVTPITTPITVEPLIPTPILDNPIFAYPLMPAFLNQKDVEAIPLYRLYKADIDVHNYTTSSAEKSDLIAAGWADDGIVSYISPLPMKNFIPLYKYRVWGQYYVLSTGSNPFYPIWQNAGIVGYVADYDLVDIHPTYELVKELSEGDDPWDTDYYYDDTFWSIGPYGSIPQPKSGYNTTSKRLNTWDKADTLQYVRFYSFETDMTGNTNYQIRIRTMRSGGTATLMYSSDNGDTWNTLVEGLEMTSTSRLYSWEAPNITSSEMKLRALWTPDGGSSAAAWETSDTFSLTKDPDSPDFVYVIPGIFILNLAPASPTNLTADPGLLIREINLYWEDNSSTETGYVIERKSGGSFAEIATVGIDATSYKDLDISSDIEYTYRVAAKGASVNSAYSNEASATHRLLVTGPEIPDGFVMPEFPDPPENVTAAFTDGSNSEVLIEWDPPMGDYTGFKVEKNSGSGWADLGTTTDDDHNYVDVDLAGLSGLIFYRVKTYDEALTSAPAEPVFVNLDDGVPEELEPLTPTDIFDGSQSGWAEAEILEAYNNGLTYPGILYDYDKAITREEFCTMAVKLYEELTGLNPMPGANPFNDTNNPEVLKAYSLGIINGVSADQFAPAYNVTRQEMCVMLYRALDAAGRNISVDPTAAFPFTDYADIASWAINEVKFCNQNGIMNGTSPTTIDPLLNTPREQAIILVGRTYNSFNN